MLIVDAFKNVFQRRSTEVRMLDVLKFETIHICFIRCIVKRRAVSLQEYRLSKRHRAALKSH